MALPVRDQLRYWGIAAALFVVVLWFLGDVLLPFVIGGAIAYFLDPVADRLERLGLSRMSATGIITVAGVLVFALMILMVVPALITQLLDLIDILASLYHQLRAFIEAQFPEILDRESNTHQMLVSFGETLKSKTGDVLQTVLASLGSAINVVVLLVIVPVVAVYLLMDWDRTITRIGELLPRDHAPTLKRLAEEIDAVLDAVQNVEGRPQTHQIPRFLERQRRSRTFDRETTVLDTFTDADAADGVAGKIEIGQLSGGPQSQILEYRALDDAE